MKQLHASSVVLDAAAMVFLAAQPVWAQTTQITEVQLSPVDGGINVTLTIASGSRPQIFTTKKGNTLVADIINTQLRLPQGNSFRQDNPAPGIASVTVNQLDATSIQLRVTGTSSTPNSQPVVRNQNEIILGFTSTQGTQAAPPSPSPQQSQKPDVLVPNPQVSINGTPTQAPGSNTNQAPPFLPRAVAPPVGDIAISNIDASPSNIDLGTQERVSRLVLRDAPVREVLSLLARAAGLNLAFAAREAGEQAAGGQQGTTGGEGPTISLDIENEPVQDVFNYVLRLSGLEANRSGRTIFVGAKLPNSTRDVIVRGMRLNQVTVGVALNFLVGLGAETAVSRERAVTSVNAVPVGAGANPITQTQTTTETRIETQRIDFKDSNPLLRGLQALGDERTNSITLIGPPRQIEMAIAQLTQLDIRRRQVVINVKIVNVDLQNTKNFNTSFSFGIGNNFFTNDGGAAVLNFGGSRPANANEVTNSLSSSPTINNPQPDNPLKFPRRLLASLQAQVTNGNAKILTDPTLIVQEGQSANVNLTQEVVGNIQRQIVRDQNLATETITADKEQVGLTLAVKVERIDDNGFVSLSVAPVVKAPQAPVDINVGGGSQQIFLVSQRSLNSGLIRLRDGQTLILSGIIQDSDRVTVSKIPILGDIPILGALFRRTNKTSDRSEVIVLLTPQIVEDSERSSFGYNYTPSPDVRQMLERGGMHVPKR
ncbi:type II and III secretion system protein [Scytonema sp. HK-05]|uniref:type IV pilus secretin family protein n=1 Tax=Scytonema sp. HK-05 TaxID=1137095 RepID=UPI000937C5E2|nr:type IV pilus secretin family protein [Scytonema sp. HK-05]OKH60619.1 type II and III secretion system protein [Scytonema sp. HK-05]BAY46020.1 type II and III secretion system protein [Scytonema sp. HK-05]